MNCQNFKKLQQQYARHSMYLSRLFLKVFTLGGKDGEKGKRKKERKKKIHNLKAPCPNLNLTDRPSLTN